MDSYPATHHTYRDGMTHRLREASLHVTPGSSVIVPLAIPGLPAEIEALGRTWQRKREFHLTAVAAEVIERSQRPDRWERALKCLAGRAVGPLSAREEIRRVSDPERPDLLTLVVMVDAPGLGPIYQELSAALELELELPPAHVTLYSSDPAEGIGLADQRQLQERAPALDDHFQQEVRQAIGFAQAFFDDGGVPFDPTDQPLVRLGRTDERFTPPVMHAMAYAAHVHHEQLRKGTETPYLAHLMAVASLVAEDGGGERELIAAFLHDTAEDHGGLARLRDLRRRFGPEVEAIVASLSDALGDEGERKPPWHPRKERYLEHLWSEPSEAVLRIANADKLHNSRSILRDLRAEGPSVWDRFTAPAQEQLWYYGELARLFAARRAASPLSRALEETVAALRRETAG